MSNFIQIKSGATIAIEGVKAIFEDGKPLGMVVVMGVDAEDRQSFVGAAVFPNGKAVMIERDTEHNAYNTANELMDILRAKREGNDV